MELREFGELTPVTLLTVSSELGPIANALRIVSEDFYGWDFNYTDVVRQGESSIRIFSEESHGTAVALPRPLRSLALAQELLDFSQSEARYPEPPEEGKEKGWQISQAWVGATVVAIAKAVWV